MVKKKWIDEAGNEIPVSRVTKFEKHTEKMADKLYKEATKINDMLKAFKDLAFSVSQEMFDNVMKDADLKKIEKHKGNITWYNFDRSLKFEININERIVFDDLLITASKEKLMSFISSKTTGVDTYVQDIIMDAFETRHGKLDTRKVTGLLKYRKRISDKTFAEAMELLEKSIKRPSSKKYFRIWVRNEAGEYENLELNFTSV